jgi:hypothetical protein
MAFHVATVAGIAVFATGMLVGSVIMHDWGTVPSLFGGVGIFGLAAATFFATLKLLAPKEPTFEDKQEEDEQVEDKEVGP